MPNAIISPHVSGLTPRHGERATEIFLRNLRAFLIGNLAAMTNVIGPKLGY